MGEMCLAEEMFEEAKQVFERLTKADPSRTQFWEQLNRARAGLGLSPMMPPTVLHRPPVPLPVHLVATTQAPPLAAPAPVPAAPPLALAPVPAPVQAAPAPAPPPLAPSPVASAPALPPLPAVEPSAPAWLPGMGPSVEAAPAPLETPAPVPAPAAPPASAPAPAFKPVVLPRKPAVAAVRVPARSLAPAVPAAAGRIERATYTMQLGELPPAVPSALDDADEIIE